MASERTATGVNRGGRPLRWGERMVTRTVYVPVSFAARVEQDAAARGAAEGREVRFSEMVVLGYGTSSPGLSRRPGRGSGPTPSPAARSSRSSTRAKPARETSSGASASHAST